MVQNLLAPDSFTHIYVLQHFFFQLYFVLIMSASISNFMEDINTI